MNLDDLMMFGVIFVLVCGALGIVAYTSDYCEKRRPYDDLPPPDKACERDGSIESFYRRNGAL